MNIPEDHLSIIEVERYWRYLHPVRDFFINKEAYKEYHRIEGELHLNGFHVASVDGVDDGDKYIRFRFFDFDPDHLPLLRLDLLRAPVELRLRLFANESARPRVDNCQFFYVSCLPLDIIGNEGDTQEDIIQAVYFAGNHGLLSAVRFHRGLFCPLYYISPYLDIPRSLERQKLVKQEGDYVRMQMPRNVFDAAFDAINGNDRWDRQVIFCKKYVWINSKENDSWMDVNINITILYIEVAEHRHLEDSGLVNVFISYGPFMSNCVFDFPILQK